MRFSFCRLEWGYATCPWPRSLPALRGALQDRPVVDRTDLEGRYDAEVLWRPDDASSEQLAQIPADRRPPDVNIFEAFEEQAGLRPEARREPIEVLVVDHIQRADEN